jgi:hypothetical protein
MTAGRPDNLDPQPRGRVNSSGRTIHGSGGSGECAGKSSSAHHG